jgi:hypothetical protein
MSETAPSGIALAVRYRNLAEYLRGEAQAADLSRGAILQLSARILDVMAVAVMRPNDGR